VDVIVAVFLKGFTSSSAFHDTSPTLAPTNEPTSENGIYGLVRA
jgi:hypothetical protein